MSFFIFIIVGIFIFYIVKNNIVYDISDAGLEKMAKKNLKKIEAKRGINYDTLFRLQLQNLKKRDQIERIISLSLHEDKLSSKPKSEINPFFTYEFDKLTEKEQKIVEYFLYNEHLFKYNHPNEYLKYSDCFEPQKHYIDTSKSLEENERLAKIKIQEVLEYQKKLDTILQKLSN